ncbi:MAG: efflux RND transporter periplasmic adaptor subunit [Planctomycetota bacterium]
MRQVTKSLGDQVEAGEILAWLESAELGEAKLQFFAKLSKARIYGIDLPRARVIYENTRALLKTLEKMPCVEELHASHPAEVGEYHGRLVSAYAEFTFARKAYVREKTLHEKKISSEGDLIQAESAFEKAQAEYLAARDTIAFQAMRRVLDTERSQQVAEFEAAAAAQNLRILGLSEEDVRALKALVPETPRPGVPPAESGTPLAAHLDAQTRLAWYPLKAPFTGAVIEKHITLGEKLADDAQAFTIADLSQVWVQFHIYQKDLQTVRPGQRVRIRAGLGIPDGFGGVDYVAPLVEESSRTALARVVLKNPVGQWRPGLFVTVHVDAGAVEAPIVVPRTAVQMLGEKYVVFVEEDGAFEPIPVTLGRTSDGLVEITEGLKKGLRYVSKGAFELKAKLVTSALGSHAGHGH